ncbi:DUF397 domain-containing protein [Planomonospora venezuelensis]|uniref:DUF397 domain-containing protein n=1 Tax=Planomonospora venezuelensis TaxID=1999 RepID=A0A841DAN9_PLAVE|nr:DUF397 domain-containing protein [Planomonospora venezuelensis]MBB5965368.1 hypothetical protein [Planomonospora venezuelensis]GIN05135.1 hypothetical protein Pve01_67930 [Planomonospora venezuelensis]
MASNADWSRAEWRKSSYSTDGGNCVEVADNFPGVVALRDSKDPHSPILIFTPEQWRAFTSGIKLGDLDDISAE